MAQSTLPNQIKAWLFPALVSVISILFIKHLDKMTDDLQEVKNDVKELLADKNQNKIRIERLESDIKGINDKLSANIPFPGYPPPVSEQNPISLTSVFTDRKSFNKKSIYDL
jgi:hypothetical protein